MHKVMVSLTFVPRTMPLTSEVALRWNKSNSAKWGPTNRGATPLPTSAEIKTQRTLVRPLFSRSTLSLSLSLSSSHEVLRTLLLLGEEDVYLMITEQEKADKKEVTGGVGIRSRDMSADIPSVCSL
jgi:hypothetical protein